MTTHSSILVHGCSALNLGKVGLIWGKGHTEAGAACMCVWTTSGTGWAGGRRQGYYEFPDPRWILNH